MAVIEIKQLASTDASRYRSLRLAALKESPTAFGSDYDAAAAEPLAFFRERLADHQNHYFGAFVRDHLVGMAILRRETRKKTRHKGSIFGVYVLPAYRQQGAGRALLEAALARAADLGLRQVKLGVTTTGKAALRLYESCGFHQFGLEKDALRIGDQFFDVAYMVYRLSPSS